MRSTQSAIEIGPAPAPRPVQWRRALRALRQLLNDPQQTEKAFEIFLSLAGDEEEQTFQRFIAEPGRVGLLTARPSLFDRLCDRAALAGLPSHSLGRAYLAYLDNAGFAPDGLVKLKDEMDAYACSIGEALPVLDPLRECARVRGILMHDLWHVLTDYGTDEAGEAALLAFALAQFPGRANRLLTTGAAARGALVAGAGFVRYLWQAWRRGRRAVWLPALPYEELLGEPLDAVRRMARIAPEHAAHPAGIRRGSLLRAA